MEQLLNLLCLMIALGALVICRRAQVSLAQRRELTVPVFLYLPPACRLWHFR
jgi:hypothetical protein